jgi:glucose-specific phosphotransferase system IIA component
LVALKNKITLLAPLSGEVLGLDLIPDLAFGLMGKGVAISPEKGELLSPIDGEVESIFPTKHAIGLKADNGMNLLVHIGIGSVYLKGEGFVAYVVEGERVMAGQLLIGFSLDLLREKATSVITPIIVTNPECFEVEAMAFERAEAGKTALMTATSK